MERTLTADEAADLVEAAGAPTYRKRGTVSARQVTEETAWVSHNGSVLVAADGDWMLHDGRRTWSVRPEIFDQTYQQVGPNQWRKTALVRLLALETRIVVHTLEGPSRGEVGDYLAVNPGGDVWPIPAEMVPKEYVPVQGG